MIWSFSRVTAYQRCRYAWYLTYIEKVSKTSSAYAEYGKFIHSILESYYKKEIDEQQALSRYVEDFEYEVTAAVRESTKDKLFMAGVDYFSKFSWQYDNYEILGVEKEVRFKIGGYNFIGYVDLLLRDKATGDITILDHKSGEFPMKKNGVDVLKAHQEDYDRYKKQLYAYSIAVKNEYGSYPRFLKWNYTRSAQELTLPFIESELEETKKYLLDIIKQISKDKKFEPNPNYANCVMMCDVCKHCEYNE